MHIFLHFAGLILVLALGLYLINAKIREGILRIILSHLMTFAAIIYLLTVIGGGCGCRFP